MQPNTTDSGSTDEDERLNAAKDVNDYSRFDKVPDLSDDESSESKDSEKAVEEKLSLPDAL